MGTVKATDKAAASPLPLLLTLGIAGRGLAVLPGVLAAVAAVYLQAPLGSTLPALVLYLLPLVAPRIPGTLALLLAPLLLATGLDVDTLTTLSALAPVLLTFAAAAPLFLHLGGAFPGRSLVPYVTVPGILFWLLAHTLPDPWGLVLTASDVDTRAQVLVLLVVVALTDLTVRLSTRRHAPIDPS